MGVINIRTKKKDNKDLTFYNLTQVVLRLNSVSKHSVTYETVKSYYQELPINTIKIGNSICISSDDYDIVKSHHLSLTSETKNVNENQQEEKKEHFIDDVRQECKKKIKKKFIVGKKYYLKHNSLDGSKEKYVIYELVKYIYSINKCAVNSLVVKQLTGTLPTTMFTLNKHDCRKYHIKYQNGLQVLPMELNWHPLNEQSQKFKEILLLEKVVYGK